jgi:hypothetical protein
VRTPALDVPFYANTPDATHCFQAALRMALKCFRPVEEYSWAELDAITAKAEGVGTWPFAGLTWLHHEGRSYIVEFLGEDIVAATPLLPDLSSEQAAAAKFVETVRCETRIPGFEDLRRLLADGYLAICNVNSRTLNERDGYSGHFVVVTSCDANELVLHDPGPPPQAQRRVSAGLFDKAWAYPSERARNIAAIKLG